MRVPMSRRTVTTAVFAVLAALALTLAGPNTPVALGSPVSHVPTIQARA